ncbi:MAG: hypothetical protein PHY48_15730 [Candidatus Cloacimonetes bacterium]|jgi:hypothetical protein|nr:hypothetical protein [Candidatus Cloacimonadota bacterium]MDY0326042.1 hypothetical protein [Candidatus Cloacimonadaceae bacterium]
MKKVTAIPILLIIITLLFSVTNEKQSGSMLNMEYLGGVNQ